MKRFIVSVIFLALYSIGSPVFADRPLPNTNQFDDDQMARWAIYSTQVFPGIYNQTLIMYDKVNHNVNRREAITNLAVTLFNSTLTIKSLLNYKEMSDLLFLTTVLQVEIDYIRMVSSGPIEKEIRSMLFAGIKTSLGSPTAFAKYCSTHTVSSIIKSYDIFQLWELSRKINQATALNDLMWNYFAFGGDTDEIKSYYNIDDSYCTGTSSGFDCVVKYFADTRKVDHGELQDGALTTLRYINTVYRNVQNIEKQTPSIPTLNTIPNGANPNLVTFSWNRSGCEECGEVSYNLEVHKDGNAVFKSDEYDGHLIKSTSYTLPIALDPDTTYYWTVFPKSQYGIWNFDTGEWPGFTTGTTASNTLPRANFTLSQATGTTSTTFNANASGSYDPDGDSIEYRWNWGDNPGFIPWSSTPTASHKFQTTGSYNITLSVRDSSTESYDSKSVTVRQANTPPSKVINSTPENNSFSNSADTDISWADGGGANSYDVYFGKSPEPSNNTKTTQPQTVFDPGILEYDTTYYWRVDPVNPYGTTTGNVWSFTTESPPPWIGYFYWDFDTDGTEGWTARNAASQGIYNNDYWVIDPEPDTAGKSGIISAPNLTGIHAGLHDTIRVRTAVKSEFIPYLQAHLRINNEWMPPITLSCVSGEQLPDSQCVYKGNIPYSGAIQQARIDFVDGSGSLDDRVFIDKVEFLNLYGDSTNAISGYVRDAQGDGISNVLLKFSNDEGSTITDATGFYTKAITPGWSGTATPYRALYSFYPSSATYSSVSSSRTGDYTGTPPGNSSSETINFQEYSGANDGFIFNHGFDGYLTIQSADEANQVSRPDHTTMLMVGQDRASSGEYYVYRASIPFDTSNLPEDCTITGARLYLYGYDEDYSHTDFNLEIVPSGQTVVSALSNEDYGNFGTTSGGSVNSGTWQGHNGVNCIPLNMTGISWINKTEVTVLGLRSSRDISQSEPSNHEFINIWSRQSDTPYKPCLVVDYAQGYDNTVSGTIRLPAPDTPTENLVETDETEILVEVGYPPDIAENGLYLNDTPVRPFQGVPFSTTSYVLTNTTPGHKTIYAWFEDQAGNRSSVPATAEFTLVKPDILYGTVTDLSSKHPIAAAVVSTSYGHTTQTNPQGEYSLEGLYAGVYDISFAKTGYQTLTLSNIFISSAENNMVNAELTTPGLLNITTPSLAPALTNTGYNERVRISGGTYPYTYDVASGALPPGLSLDSTYGNISGTPEVAGSYTFTIGVTDFLSAHAARGFTIDVAEQPVIVTGSPLAPGTKGDHFFAAIEATGGTQPYTFSILNGSIPTNMYLSTAGVLSGIPSSTGSYDFTIKVQDASARTAEKSLHLEIANPLVILTSKLNNGIAEAVYNQTLSAQGGKSPYRWSVYSGKLPPGLSVDCASGILSGTPMEATYGTIILSAADNQGRVAYKDFTLQVADPLKILTTSLPTSSVGLGFSEAIRVKGGIKPYSFNYSGQLPPGLTLNPATGIISGTPTTMGDVNVSITISDHTYPTTQATTQTLGLRTTSDLIITTPAVLPKGKKNVPANPIILLAGCGPSPYTWSIANGYLPDGISLDTVTGEVSGIPVDKGDFIFSVQVTDSVGDTALKELYLHVSDDLTIVTGAVPDGAKEKRYSYALEAKGGFQPYTWRIKSGTLPTGLSFNNSTGTIHGKPTTRQTFSITVEINDADSPAQTAEKTYIIDVLDDLYIYTDTIANGRLDQAYIQQFYACLGTPPYEWRLESGLLPPGLILERSPFGVSLEGMPMEVGTHTFTLEVSDSGTPIKSVTREYAITIYGNVFMETTGLQCARSGVPYSDTLTASFGPLPYRWQIAEGSLPQGLCLNSSTGHISGTTHLVSGQSSTFKLQCRDSGNPSGFDEQEFVIYVIDPLEIVTEEIHKGLQNAPFQAPLEGTGGVSPYTWSLSPSSLPSGISINPNTGMLQGTPLQCGIFNFPIKIKDSAPVANTITRAFQLEILCSNDDSDHDGLSDDIEENGCTQVDNPDTDGDGIKDGDEDKNHNGVKEANETDPCNADTDDDNMPDKWETDHNLDPLTDDAAGDKDGDGFSNLREYYACTAPWDIMDIPYFEPEIENFETGDFTNFPWKRGGSGSWSVIDTSSHEGQYSARSFNVEDYGTASLETNIFCEAGQVSFWYAVDSEADYDFLNFYIDGTLIDQWSGYIDFTRAEYAVDTGMHNFKWVYEKDKSGSVGDDATWIDDITFPGSVDSDADGMPDGWEIDNDLKPLTDDSAGDADKDLFTNHMEYLMGTDPINPTDFPAFSNGFDADLDVDGLDLIRFVDGLTSGMVIQTELPDFAKGFGK